MRAFVATVAAITAVLITAAPPPAEAHLTNSRTHAMRHVAEFVITSLVPGTYGQVCDVGTMNVPIVRVPTLNPPGVNARASWLNWGPGRPITNCVVSILDRSWTTSYLCRLVVHEMLHFAGLQHSKDPENIMWPGTLGFFSPCVPRRIRKIALSYPP